jgi:hypothetical protein
LAVEERGIGWEISHDCRIQADFRGTTRDNDFGAEVSVNACDYNPRRLIGAVKFVGCEVNA